MSDLKSFSFDFNVAKKKLSNDAIVDYLRNTAHTNINWNFFNNQDNDKIVDSLSANSDGIEIYDVGQEALREDMQERAKNLYAQKDTQGEKILNFFGDMFHTQDSKARKRQEEDLERNLKYLDINALDDEGANALANALSLQTLDKDTGKLLSAKDSLAQRKNALLQKDEILNTQNYHDLSAEQKKVVDEEVGAVENFFRDYVPFVDNREKNFKEWQQVERNKEFVNSELLPKIEALKSETFRIADLLSSDTEKRAKAQGFLDDVAKIAQAFGFDDAGYDKDSNLYIGKDGEFYRVNENFFDNFLNIISATKFELGGSLAGGIYGLKAGKNAGKLGALGGAIAGAALGAMGGSVADSIVNHYLLDKDAGAKDIIHKSLEAGALSVVGDIAMLGLSKIPLKSTIHKATSATNWVVNSNVFTGTAKNYLKGQNIQAAQDLLNASVNAEQQAAIKAFAKEFGGDIKKFDKQRVTPQIEQAFGADSVITKTAQKLDDLLIRNDKGNAQRELLEIIRSDDSSLSLGLLLEVAQESPTANKALRDLLKATTINLEKQLETLNISPQTAFTIFRDLQVGTKESYNQAINEVLNELYQDKRTILNRAPYDKLRADLEQNILLGQNELNFLKFVENNIFNPQGVTFSQLNNAKKILNSFYKDVQGGTKDYLKNVVEKDLKQQIDNAIFEIFKTEPKLYGEAKNLYENALSDYATMANTIKTLKKIGFDKSTKTQEEALNTLIKYAKGGGGIAEIPNYAELTKGLSEANKQSLELSALQQIFTESLIGDESFKVFDSKAFFKKLGNLENVFNTQGAKEYIGFLRGFDKLFHNDAEIALRLGFASPKQEGSSIATSLQGAMQQKFIKGVFATLIRNLPHNSIIIKGLGFSEKVQGAALRYHLRRALDKSQDINDFKYHFSQKATHYPFNNATKEIIKRITNDVLEAINNESPNELKFKTMYKENGDLNNNEAITQAIKEFGENYPLTSRNQRESDKRHFKPLVVESPTHSTLLQTQDKAGALAHSPKDNLNSTTNTQNLQGNTIPTYKPDTIIDGDVPYPLTQRQNTIPTTTQEDIIDVEIIQNYITHTPRNKLREDLSDLTKLYPETFTNKASVLTNTLRMLNNPKLLVAPKNPEQQIIKETLAQKSGAKRLAEIPQNNSVVKENLTTQNPQDYTTLQKQLFGNSEQLKNTSNMDTENAVVKENLTTSKESLENLTDIPFRDSKGKEQILSKEIQEQWLKTFNLKSLEDTYTPQLPQEVKEALGGKEIRLQLGSLKKLVSQGREQFIPQIKAVLDEPEAILKDSDNAFLFAKHLKDDDYFVNVSVDKGEYLVSISNGIKETNNIKNKLDFGAKVIYQSPNANSNLQTLLQASRYSANKIDNNIIPQNAGIDKATQGRTQKQEAKKTLSEVEITDKEISDFRKRLKELKENAKKAFDMEHNLASSGIGMARTPRSYEEILRQRLDFEHINMQDFNDLWKLNSKSEEFKNLLKKIYFDTKKRKAIYEKGNRVNPSEVLEQAQPYLKQFTQYSKNADKNELLNMKYELLRKNLSVAESVVKDEIIKQIDDILHPNLKYFKESETILKWLRNGFKDENNGKSIGAKLSGFDYDKYRAILEDDLNLHPIKEFGTNYAEYYRDGQGAIAKIIAEAKDYKVRKTAGKLTPDELKQGAYKGQVAGAFYRKDLEELSGNGDIDLVWGEITDAQAHKGYGLAHILDKHPDFDINLIPQIVENGKLINQNNVRFRLEFENYVIGLSTEFKGEKQNFIITAFERNKDLDTLSPKPKITDKSDNILSNLDNNIIPQTKLQSNVHIGNGLASGSVAGFETDEQGNISFNPANFLLGLAGGAAGSKAIAKGFKAISKNPEFKAKVVKELADTLSKGWEAATKKYPILESLQPRYIVKNDKGRDLQAQHILREVEITPIHNALESLESTPTPKKLTEAQIQKLLKEFDNLENLQEHLSTRADNRQEIYNLLLDTKEKPQIQYKKDSKDKYLKKYKSTGKEPYFYLLVTQDKDKTFITHFKTRDAKYLSKEIADSDEIVKGADIIEELSQRTGDNQSSASTNIIPQIQAKFKFDEKKAKDLSLWHKDSSPLTKDEQGLPRVFYHGTGDDYGFEIFKPNAIDGTPAIYFTTSKKVATSYAQMGYTKEGIYKTFLNIKNPLVVDFRGKSYDGLEYEKLLKKALKNGNDGVIIKNVFDDTGGYYDKQGNFKEIGKADTFIVFNPNQIKAVENKGLKGESGEHKYFNAESPNIYQSNVHIGNGLASGSVAGFETDEQGNLSFNPTNFLLGLAGGAVGSKAIAKGFKAISKNPEFKEKVTKELADTLSKGWEAATKKYPILESLQPRYIVKNDKGRDLQAQHILREVEQKEAKGLYNVAYNGKNATRVLKDLEAVDEAILFEKGNRYKGAKHIRIKHLRDANKEGYVKPIEVANLGKDLRNFLKDYEPFEEVQKSGQKARIYEWENTEGVRFRLVVNDIADMDSNPTTATQEIITFYSDRNLKERMKFKNPKVQEAYEKEINKELIPQIQAKFKFDEKKAKDLAEIPQTKLQSNVHIGNGLASGSVAGFETDEQGNISFNPANFLLGLAGGAAGSKAIAKGFKAISKNPEFKAKVTKELADTLSKGWDSAVKQYPILESLQPRYIVKNKKGRIAQSKAILKEVETKAGKLEKAFLLENRLNTDALEKEAIELPKELEWRDFKKQFEAKGMKVAIDTPIGKVNINVYKAYAHFTNNTYKKDRRKFSGAFLDTLTNPLFVMKQKYRPEMSQVAKKANAMRSNNALVSKIQNKTRLQTGNDEIIQDSYVFYKPFRNDKGLVHLASFAIAQNGELLHKTFYDIKNLSKLQRILKSKDENVIYFKGEQ